ncbi:hypothetical protein CKO42_17355 [Lamprobacter modestohalophilus]|uniref:Tyrosine specific protein phosphatases domain-containing protein n=1 Tax=Lamprobacter modestohalophilus TaxID=1064514 RepID=A0A9X1B554_9GAMM|nr:ADP-ribosylglycohydrolase family protein [Lamprobacter modestohalophilus]MBK1620175.1 hypothetical protein [Lamprobacter modestohalophilus]
MARLTSETHPLRIDAVDTPTGGLIGMTLCPGKQQSGSVSGDWYRDLGTDLRVIADWGAAAVVTLMEPKELAWVGVAHMGSAVEALGLDWYHLPIRDVQPPGQRFENRWVLYGLRLRRILRRGGRVLIHCRGGLGRSGTVAARLLVELGMTPEAAIAAVRRARPGTIETRAQRHHVQHCKAPEQDEAFVDRALGCLLGGAAGDGFGYAVEFDSLNRIQQRFGPEGLRHPVFHEDRLRVSDDTQMTLFTLEGLAQVPDRSADTVVIDRLRQAYLDWLNTQRPGARHSALRGTLAKRPAMQQVRAPGNTCLSALGAGGQGTPERPINASKSCGGVMRVAPIGWASSIKPRTCFDQAARAAALTHGHPDGWLSAGMLAVVMQALFSGQGLRAAIETAKTVTEAVMTQQGVRADLLGVVAHAERLAVQQPDEPTRAIEAIGLGWVGEEALAIALYAVLSADSFEDAVQRAANHGGDSDSTAAIAGQLWGAWKGLDALPMAWVRRLDVLPECLHGVAELARRGYRAAATEAMRREVADSPSGTLPSDDAFDLGHCSLYEHAERVQALTAFYHRKDAALMTFTARVWDSLLEPKGPKVAFMAETLGIEGHDRLALRKVLAAYLRTTDERIAALDDPLSEASESAEPIDNAALRHPTEHIAAIIDQQTERWARLLNVEPMDPLPDVPQRAAVIHGPWIEARLIP